ncbi:hypothetical protein EYZ11_003406 [Aspergillus tanneri]|uniref:Metallo-beta-lactamase domain-containing protein n=1 Tax=Aspergillus tanneri TaxID=1220188 RepID=A0A4S3JQG8_9EURO|nr:uncharacterized protein ATNIH1004_010139 [Aspergillus tanneri]KAA8643370.1 hypothetical protein ATNIH1004_010139 [Aspergillus tanneri]THC97088.1 hypothetical protein EYZ11_003406 [Aspergillus tanneri]
MTVTTSGPEFHNHDFEFATRSLVLTPEDPIILNSNSDIVWDTGAYDFLQAECPGTANPSLWRQGQLCSVQAGLYIVTEAIVNDKKYRIYQVRGFDLANMSIVQIPDSNGIIIIDCLTSVETAKRAIDLYQKHHHELYGTKADIKALLYTHCHADHFGGAQAVREKADRDLQIIGPDGFLEHAVSENVYAGAAMSRRSIYMYGEALEKSPSGQIGCGLGQALSTGSSSLVPPTRNITHDGPLDLGFKQLEINCQLTPGTEAPAEVNFYFPQYKALCMAENATHTLHNIQTLRGAPVRDARLWSRYLDESISLFGDKTDVVFASHHWPTWNVSDGNPKDESLVVTFLAEQRDYYAYLHNESLRQLNDGKLPGEIAEDIQMPPTLKVRSNLRGYYGSINHNVKGVYDKYMGWFDGNPANLWPLAPADEATEFVKCMGGSEAVIRNADDYVRKKNYRFAATLLNKVIFADATNQAAKDALASVYTALGQGAENGTWRNIYLTGALELQNGPQKAVNTMTTDSLLALNFDELFDTMAILIEGPRAYLQPKLTIDFYVEDMQQLKSRGAGWHLRLSNGALTGHAIPYIPAPSKRTTEGPLKVWLSHKQLVTLIGLADSGKPSSVEPFITSGSVEIWKTITSFIKLPNLAFNIVTP